MYNKLFTKILDSSVWLEPDATRLVWITFIAMMDEDGFVELSTIGNVSARARVSLAAAKRAIESLEGPDRHADDQEHQGRRIERVPNGWVVLNAEKYRNIVSRMVSRESNRLRVAKHRAKKKAGNGHVMPGTHPVMQSEAVSTASDSEGVKTPFRNRSLKADLGNVLKRVPDGR